MKVLHVNDCAGVATNLVHGLNSHGVEAELYQPTVGTYRANKLKRLALPLLRTLEAFQLRSYVKKNQFDIVHIHYARFAYMTLLSGQPYYLHCHGGDLSMDLYRVGLRELTIQAIRKARKVFYSTPDLKKHLVNLRDDAIFLPNPVKLEEFKPFPSKSQHLPCVLSISKLDRRKGLDHILCAIELVWKVRPQIKIALFNFGDAGEKVQRFIDEYRNHPSLTLLPYTPHNEMPGLINTFSIVLGQQSPQIRALGVSELEAMACGKPVICNFAFPDAYPEPPPVLVSNTPEESCNHILQLLDAPDRRHLIGERGRQWVTTYHDYRRVTQAMISYYQESC